jgi:cytidylate kinase
MPVVTMTREMGSLGVRVAQQVTERLKIRLVYHELVQNVADVSGLETSAVVKYLEGQGTGFMGELFGRSRHLGLGTVQEILELAREGNVLIRGWGANFALVGVPGVVRVRVCAPMRQRVENMMKRMESLDYAHWQKEVEESDRLHATAIARIYGVENRLDAANYDLVLDTSLMTVEQCTHEIVRHVCESPLVDCSGMRDATDDSLLAARIRYGISNDAGVNDERISVTAIRGVVILEGIVSTQAVRGRIVTSVSQHRGVTRVDDRLREMRESARYMSE